MQPLALGLFPRWGWHSPCIKQLCKEWMIYTYTSPSGKTHFTNSKNHSQAISDQESWLHRVIWMRNSFFFWLFAFLVFIVMFREYKYDIRWLHSYNPWWNNVVTQFRCFYRRFFFSLKLASILCDLPALAAFKGGKPVYCQFSCSVFESIAMVVFSLSQNGSVQ